MRRGRSRRRGVDERTRTIVELLSGTGNAQVAQVAFRSGVKAKTLEKSREVALEGIEQFMRNGSCKIRRER
ncbi:MAG: hypothetical protein WHX93_18350 [bacterium]